ncbi:hypothetical protein DP124_10970 [Clostridium tetani]|nr:hypothetical protein DP124_10970 [Clostridium tetani]RXI56993.1 hypothetical protein DP122_00830 [Clostridium tetani]
MRYISLFLKERILLLQSSGGMTMYDKRKLNKKKFTRSLLIILILLSIPTFLIKIWVNNNSKKSSSAYLTHKDKPIEETKKEDKSSSEKSNEKDIKKDNINLDSKPLNINITDYKTFFKDSIILGDSISEGLSFYEVLDTNNVIAKKGLTLYKAQKEVPNIVVKNPKKLFIFLGNNDLFEENLTKDQFIKQYSSLVNTIRQNVPNTKIYILSILPVSNSAEKENSFLNRERILSFNNAIKYMAEKHNLNYINTLPVIQSRENLYEQDGIHFKYDFYKYLLSYVENYIKKNNI